MAKKNKQKMPIELDSESQENTAEETNNTLETPDKVEVENTSRKDKVALLLSLVIVGALAFFTYRYFNASTSFDLSNKIKENKEEVSDIISSATQRDTTKEEKKETEQKQQEQPQTTDQTQTKEKTAFAKLDDWRATDYKKGDIATGTSHTVQSGDTLWELAEAAYGSGAEWGRILAANSNSIGFLPSGSQALIVPGQVLVIPAY